jgi:HEAT repeat protein
MRALLDGVVFYSAMSIAGVLLLLVGGSLETSWLALLGGAFAVLYASANLIVRREYLSNLVEGIRSGRLDLQDFAGNLDLRELEALAEMWGKALDERSSGIALALLQLAAPLARHGFADVVRQRCGHPDPRARLACLDALADCGDEVQSELLRAGLEDRDPAIRRRAASLAAQLPLIDGELRDRLRPMLADADAVVRARVAALLGLEGQDTLRAMLVSDAPGTIVAALAEIPADLVPDALARIESQHSEVQAAVIECLTRLDVLDALPPEQLVEDLRHEDPAVRRSAAAALASRHDEEAIHALARALDDVSRTVRLEAQVALSSLGDAGVHAAAPYTKGSRVWTVDAALSTIAEVDSDIAQAVLRRCYGERVREAWMFCLAIAQSGQRDDVDARFLRAALDNAYQRATGLALRILELSEDPAVVRSIRRELDIEASHDRGEALEVLSNLGERADSQLFALLLEDEALEEKLPALSSIPGGLTGPTSLDDVLHEASHAQDRWLRLAAARYGRGTPPTPQEREIMERLLALQSVPLFTHLSLEQLEIINRLLQEVQYLSGEVIVREGDPGDELFVLVEGEVEFIKAYQSEAEEPLHTMRPVGYFGEIAVLDDEPRSLTVRASEDSRLLTLAGARFKELIMQAPEISFEVFPVLIRRIRAAEERLSQKRQSA